ncbi:MAG: sec-independent protein translocase protein TatD DNase family protein [Candidatus Nomurabacteria bacterium]|nr:sec-independent protein translocase protein TatD DNase family protein [Candidatus Nomurabacteria bacterium]
MNYSFFDIHSHLHDKSFDEDRDYIIDDMKNKNIGTILVGSDITESKKAVALAELHDNLYATVGLHPTDNMEEIFHEHISEYKELLKSKKVVAIGECGLDYYRLQEDPGNPRAILDEKLRQKIIFDAQIKLALEVNKPLMVHGRPSKGKMDAYEDMLELLENYEEKHGEKLQGNAHFFVGNIEIAKRFIDIGFTMSFSGVITFASEYEEVVRFIPLEHIHAETDSPYATPVPNRGKRNDPRNVKDVVAKIAEIKGEAGEKVREQLLKNARRTFGI